MNYLIELQKNRVAGGGGNDQAAEQIFSRVWNSKRPMPIGHPLRFVIEKTAKGGLRVRDLERLRFQEIPADRVEADGSFRFAMGHATLNVRPLSHNIQGSRAIAPEFLTSVERIDDTFDNAWFFKFARNTGIGFAVLLATVLLIPGPKVAETPDNELIPPQFAKILMKAQEKVEKGGGGDPLAGGAVAGEKIEGKEAKAPTKASNTAVARAFRAQALQNSVKGLLKGGMTTFLAQSGTLLLGADSSNQVKRVMEGGTNAALPASPDAGFERGPNVDVGSVGGGGLGGHTGTGKGIGYGKGERAGIGGQGGAFVSLDIPGANVEDGLSKDEVAKVIHSHLSEVRYCYESSMIRNPDVEGKLMLDFTIAGGGNVSTASVRESSLKDPRLDDCILRRLTKWAFPKPKGGVSVAVSYPFIFKALQR